MPLTKSLALTQLTLWFQNFNWQTPGHRAGFFLSKVFRSLTDNISSEIEKYNMRNLLPAPVRAFLCLNHLSQTSDSHTI